MKSLNETKMLVTSLYLLFGFCFYILFVWAPVSSYTESQCLKQGFPKSEVTIGLDRYCLSYDGAVTPKVIKQ